MTRFIPVRIALNLVAVASAIAVGLSTADLVLRHSEQQSTAARIAAQSHRNCLAVEHLKSYAYASALRAQKTLPTLAYYRQNPEDLRKALVEVAEQIKFFAPHRCP